MMQTWTSSRFRSSRALDLKRFDELAPEQQNAFRELQKDDDFYGLLVPRVSGAASLKSVGRQTAQLFASLGEPSRLDALLLDDASYREDIIDLILDGILEIEIGGAFCSGADAFRIVASELPAAIDRGRIGTLSREALQHAEDLPTRDAAAITNALYLYHRMPRTRAWDARFPNREAVLRSIGANSGPTASLLDRNWIRTPTSPESVWISWQTLGPRMASSTMTWKLYVSPHPGQIADAFRALVRVLADLPGSQMKIGHDAAGLLRPDKLIAYFTTQDDLDTAARALANDLRGCTAHGVPFTAGFLGTEQPSNSATEEPAFHNGLLSWGVDPPDSERALSWLERESWRLWLARTLGASLAFAKNATRPVVEPWRFAIERVRRHGVDVDTWTPNDTLWRSVA
jgi:hypothetical protein